MRTIKFRGQTAIGKWIYGNYSELNGIHFITPKIGAKIPSSQYEVIPETVGQFTGLLDKNGKEIYEGDIVNYDFFKMDSGHHQAKILFQTCYSTKHISNTYTRNLDYIDYSFEWLSRTNSNITIIGSIHDNPELLTEK